MSNLVIIGISDTADRIIRFVNRYHLFRIIGCAVDAVYVPENQYVVVGGRIPCLGYSTLARVY